MLPLSFVYFGVFILAFFTSLVVTKWCIALSFQLNFLDIPHSIARKNHKTSTPLLGGGAVYGSFYFTLFILCFLAVILGDIFIPQEDTYLKLLLKGGITQLNRLALIFIGGTLMFLLGLVDDKRGVSPWVKLFIILGVAILLFYLDIKITVFIYSPWLNFLLTLGWITILVNSFNLLDNMNGLSGGVALVASFILLLVSLYLGQVFISLYLIAFIGALLGFLRYNYFGGKIFLGDSGALFIGYNLAVISIIESFYLDGVTEASSVFLPLYIFTVPFYDTLSVILIRLHHKVSIFKGDLNHFSHRINRGGWTKNKSVILIVSWALILGLITFILCVLYRPSYWLCLIGFPLVLLLTYGYECTLKKNYRNLNE